MYNSNMAAPITHLVFAITISSIDSRDFLVGNSFPDIRYLGSISREETHLPNESRIVNTTSFISGVKFHQYIDELRGEYWRKNGIYEKLPKTPLSAQALKFCEDMIFYEKIKDWGVLAEYFRNVVSVESSLFEKIPNNDIVRWYSMLADYIEVMPTFERIGRFASKLGLHNAAQEQLLAIIDSIITDKSIVDGIKEYYSEMNVYIKQQYPGRL